MSGYFRTPEHRPQKLPFGQRTLLTVIVILIVITLTAIVAGPRLLDYFL